MCKFFKIFIFFIIFTSFKNSFSYNFFSDEENFFSLFFSNLSEIEKRFRSKFEVDNDINLVETSNLKFKIEETENLIKLIVEFPEEISSENLESEIEGIFENGKITVSLNKEKLFFEAFISKSEYAIKSFFTSKKINNDKNVKSFVNQSIEQKNRFKKNVDLERLQIFLDKDKNLLEIEIPYLAKAENKNNNKIPIKILNKIK